MFKIKTFALEIVRYGVGVKSKANTSYCKNRMCFMAIFFKFVKKICNNM